MPDLKANVSQPFPPRRQVYVCTYPVFDSTYDPEEGQEPESHPCGRVARATYTKGKEALDRCARHDTPGVQATATKQNYKRTELNQ